MATYVALLRKSSDNLAYQVEFPDFPACGTTGATLEEASDMAKEALDFHIRGMVYDGTPIPDPTSLNDIINDPELSGAVPFFIMVPHQPSNVARVSLTIPVHLLKRLDRIAKAHDMTRSALVSSTCERVLSEHSIELGEEDLPFQL